MKKLFFILSLMLLTVGAASAQSESTRGSKTITVQPKIMVIPYTKEGEDIRTILENDQAKRVAISKVKEAFDSRGFTTIDFTQRVRNLKSNAALQTDAATDIKTDIIAGSGADIYVEVDMLSRRDAAGTSLDLILNAYEASSGNALASKNASSGTFMTNDYGKLASKAVDGIAEDFLTVLQDKFTEIVKNGRSVFMEIAIADGSDMSMSSEVGSDGSLLSDAIETWLADNAYQGYYSIQGVSDNGMIINDVRIPLSDQETGGNYTATRFANAFTKFLRSVNLTATRVVKNQTILFTIK